MWTGPRTFSSPRRWRRPRDDHDRCAESNRCRVLSTKPWGTFGRRRSPSPRVPEGQRLMDLSCWGIFRERTNSPGRETDDAEILRLTAKHLEAAGFQVSLKSAEEVGSLTEPRPRC